jgi:GAF domain-containing protein
VREPSELPAQLRDTCRELVDLLVVPGCVLSRVIGELLIGVAEWAPRGRSLHLGHGYLLSDYPLTREVIETLEPRIVAIDEPDPDPNEVELLRELGFESLLMLPLAASGECWGLVEIYGTDGRRFDEADIRLVEPVLARATALLTR